MGQTSCCESSANKKSLYTSNSTDQSNIVTSIKTDNNNNQFGKIDNPQNVKPSINNLTNSGLIQNNEIIASNVSNSSNSRSRSSYNENNKVLLRDTKSLFTCIDTFEAHEDKIVSLIELSTGNVASGSYDCTIKIWDINSKNCIKTI